MQMGQKPSRVLEQIKSEFQHCAELMEKRDIERTVIIVHTRATI